MYYVATNGDDTYEGSATNPWRTVSQALSAVSNGDWISIGKGQFPEWLSVTTAVTICGSDSYFPTNKPLSRHQSNTILLPPDTDNPRTALIRVRTGNVAIRYLTISGDADTNGTPDIEYGIYSTNKPLTVDHCVISRINGYGICCHGDDPAPAPGDTDRVRGYIAENMITNITHTNITSATGIFLDHAPVTCISNEIVTVRGTNANAGIYVESCYYTTNMSDWIRFDWNYFSDCTMALWANKFGSNSEKIHIDYNCITNSVIGIRVSASKGQAEILGNRVSVGGSTPYDKVPARGIWVQADYDPWDTDTNYVRATDHLVWGNKLTGSSTNVIGTIGMLFEYDITPSTTNNNGVRAQALYNTVQNFDYGAYVKSGSHDVSKPHDPLVQVVLNYNDIVSNISYGVFSAGDTNHVNAISNWWGSVNGPILPFANPVSSNVDYIPWTGYRVGVDTDGDGIPDWLDPDIDGDGALNWEETIAGTDPSNRLSVFIIVGDSWNPGFRLNWLSVSGKTYTVYRSTNLVQGAWLLLATRAATPPTNVYNDTNSINLKSAFYRVSVTN
jgi:hypothetical protein